MSGRYTIDPGMFNSLAFEVVLPHDARGAHCERSHVRMQAPSVAPSLEARERFVVCDSGTPPDASEAHPSFPHLAAAIDFAQEVAGTAAGADVQVWRRDRFGAAHRVATFRSSVRVTEHWHDADFAGLDR